MGEGEPPPRSTQNLLGARKMECDEGSFSVSFPASQWWTTAGGAFYGGTVAMFLDYAMHGAIHTTLPAGTSWATLDLKVNFLRPVTPDGTELRATARVLNRGRTIAVASSELVEESGRTIALANTSAMLLPGRPWQPLPQSQPLDEPVGDG